MFLFFVVIIRRVSNRSTVRLVIWLKILNPFGNFNEVLLVALRVTNCHLSQHFKILSTRGVVIGYPFHVSTGL